MYAETLGPRLPEYAIVEWCSRCEEAVVAVDAVERRAEVRGEVVVEGLLSQIVVRSMLEKFEGDSLEEAEVPAHGQGRATRPGNRGANKGGRTPYFAANLGKEERGLLLLVEEAIRVVRCVRCGWGSSWD